MKGLFKWENIMGQKIKVISIVLGIVLLFIAAFPDISYGLIGVGNEPEPEKLEPRVLSSEVWLTAYSSSPDETDDTPFVTASGERVRDGIVAANFLPLGSAIQIPEIFGDRIFVVKDRMHSRKTDFVDVWMSSKQEAKEFGIHRTDILILHSPPIELSMVR